MGEVTTMKTTTTEEEQTKVIDVLKTEPHHVTVKEIVEKIGDNDMNTKRIGKWLASESDKLGVHVTKKYGVNRYKIGRAVNNVTNNLSKITDATVLREVFAEIRNAGVDVESIITRIKERKTRELETLKSL